MIFISTQSEIEVLLYFKLIIVLRWILRYHSEVSIQSKSIQPVGIDMHFEPTNTHNHHFLRQLDEPLLGLILP